MAQLPGLHEDIDSDEEKVEVDRLAGLQRKEKHPILDFLIHLEHAILHSLIPHSHRKAPAPPSFDDEETQSDELDSEDLTPGHRIRIQCPRQFGTDLTIERMHFPDVNGLLGKSERNPITGVMYLKEIEPWRDFQVVDAWTSEILYAHPKEHVENPYLFTTRALNLRTWLYHKRFLEAKSQFRIGGLEEHFVTDALRERCVDLPTTGGLWSPAMVYLPLLPLTLIADDSTVFSFSAFVLAFTLIVSIAANGHRFYWWSRFMSLPARLAFVAVVLSRIQGGTMQLLGYLLTVFGALIDLGFGDLAAFLAMKHQCSFNVLKTLPNQVYVCGRFGHVDGMEKRRPIPEKITGVSDSGDGRVCLIANIQGLLIELLPVSAKDLPSFIEEHQQRSKYPELGHLKFIGVDLLSPECKTVADIFTKNDHMHQLQKKLMSQRQKDLTVEDIP